MPNKIKNLLHLLGINGGLNDAWFIASARRWKIVWMWIIVFTSVTIYLIHENRNLVSANKQRIAEIQQFNKQRLADIQQSRIASCQQTYEALQKVILSSIGGQKLNKEQQAAVNKLLIISSPTQCIKQTKPK